METKFENPSLCYWHGIYDLVNLDSDTYNTLVEKLKESAYKSTGLEIIKEDGKYTLYSMRTNGSDRVLASRITVDSKDYLILLEDAPNHDYEKARFYKDGVLKNYMDLNYDSIAGYIRDQEKQKNNSKQAEDPLLQHKAIMFHQKKRKIISLSKEQQDVLLDQDKTLLISGGPGSGKTLLILAMLASELKQNRWEFNQQELLVVTESELLAQAIREEFARQNPPNPYNRPVKICSYKGLLMEKGLVKHANDFVEKSHFAEFMLDHLKQKKPPEGLKEAVNSEKDNTKLIEFIHQEFRIISGYSYPHYTGQAKNAVFIPSFFTNKEHRGWLINAYIMYLLILQKTGKVDPAFYTLPKDVRLEFFTIWGDEIQDLSHNQIKFLMQCCPNGRMRFFNDANQLLNDYLSKTRFLTELCREGEFASYFLQGSYRCPEEMLLFHNALLKLKLHLTGGVLDKNQQTMLELTEDQKNQQSKEASIYWYECLEDVVEKDALLNKIKGSANIAIITLPEYQQEAKEKFNTTVSVYTPNTAKGHEFEYGILYRLFDDPIYTKANKDPVVEDLESKETPTNRPKEGKEQLEYLLGLNRTWVAGTRFSSGITIIQPTRHTNKKVVEFIKKKSLPVNKANNLNSFISSIQEDSTEAWIDRAKESLEYDEVRARNIFKSKLAKTDDEFEAWKRSVLPYQQPITNKEKSAPSKEAAKKKQESIITPKSSSPKKQNNTNTTKPLNEYEKIDLAINNKDVSYIEKQIANLSAEYLYYLLSQKAGLTLFIKACENKSISQFINNNRVFIEKLCTILPNRKLPALYCLVSEQEGRSWLFCQEKNCTMQGTWVIQLKNYGLIKHFKEYGGLLSVLFARNITTGDKFNTSVLYYILANPVGVDVVFDCAQKKGFVHGINKKFSEYFDTIMAVSTSNVDSIPVSIMAKFLELEVKGKSILSTLIKDSKFKQILLKNQFFSTWLLKDVLTIKQMDSKTGVNEGNVSCCPIEFLIIYNKPVLRGLLNDTSFINKLTNEGLHDILFKEFEFNMFSRFFSDSVGIEILIQLMSNESFANTLVARLELVSYLFKDMQKLQRQPAYYFGYILSHDHLAHAFFTNPLFILNLCTNPLFYSCFFKLQTDETLFAYHETLYSCMWYQPDFAPYHSAIFDHPKFIENAIHSDKLVNALLPDNIKDSALLHVLEKGRSSLDSSPNLFLKLFTYPEFIERLKKHPNFITTLLTKLISAPLYLSTAHPVPIKRLLSDPDGTNLLITLCEDMAFAKKLFEHDAFLNSMLSLGSNHSSGMRLLSLNNTLMLKFIAFYSEEPNINKLRNHEAFISKFLLLKELSISTPLFDMIHESSDFFFKLCEDSKFYTKLINHDDFYDRLLQSHLKMTKGLCFHEILGTEKGINFVLRMCQDPEVLNKLISHPDFISSLCFSPTDLQRTYTMASTLYVLNNHPIGIQILEKFSENEQLIQNLVNTQEFKLALDDPQEKSLLSSLMSTDIGNRILAFLDPEELNQHRQAKEKVISLLLSSYGFFTGDGEESTIINSACVL